MQWVLENLILVVYLISIPTIGWFISGRAWDIWWCGSDDEQTGALAFFLFPITSIKNQIGISGALAEDPMRWGYCLATSCFWPLRIAWGVIAMIVLLLVLSAFALFIVFCLLFSDDDDEEDYLLA